MERNQLEDGDYVANDGLWITIRGASIRIYPTDEGIVVNAYPEGREDEPAIAGTWFTYAELIE